MSRCLEDLTKNIFGNTRVESSHVQGALVRFRCSTTGKRAAAARGKDPAALVTATAERGGDSSRDRVGVLRDVQRRRRQMRWIRRGILTILVTRRASIWLGRGRQRGAAGGGGTAVSHVEKNQTKW